MIFRQLRLVTPYGNLDIGKLPLVIPNMQHQIAVARMFHVVEYGVYLSHVFWTKYGEPILYSIGVMPQLDFHDNLLFGPIILYHKALTKPLTKFVELVTRYPKHIPISQKGRGASEKPRWMRGPFFTK